jgi:hypothetical protein
LTARGSGDDSVPERVTLSSMRPLRTATMRIVVILLLGWTGADLCLPALCASESVRSCASGALNRSALQTDTTAPSRTPGQGQDDCFCCSHAVSLRPVFVWSTPSKIRDVALQLIPRIPSALPSAVYHPPQL